MLLIFLWKLWLRIWLWLILICYWFWCILWWGQHYYVVALGYNVVENLFYGEIRSESILCDGVRSIDLQLVYIRCNDLVPVWNLICVDVFLNLLYCVDVIFIVWWWFFCYLCWCLFFLWWCCFWLLVLYHYRWYWSIMV